MIEAFHSPFGQLEGDDFVEGCLGLEEWVLLEGVEDEGILLNGIGLVEGPQLHDLDVLDPLVQEGKMGLQEIAGEDYFAHLPNNNMLKSAETIKNNNILLRHIIFWRTYN